MRLLAAIVGSFFALMHAVNAETAVYNWMDANNYPSRITFIPVGDHILRYGNPVKIGAWTVWFTHQSLIASYSTLTVGIQHDCQAISTYNTVATYDDGSPDFGLVCSNAVLGTKKCAFTVNSVNGKCVNGDLERLERTCSFFVYNEEGTRLDFECPMGIGLK